MEINFRRQRSSPDLDSDFDYSYFLGPPTMRGAIVFSGSSHPVLVDAICDRLGSKRGSASLGKFANGETSVEIHTSIRDQDVFIVQSGSEKINDSLMELLIMVSACKGGSAKSVTAVMPYFPYSRQSKKKQHRGAITARMVANLLNIAGVDHVITLDLHASQMQGFFRCPVDNLIAEPLLAKWIKINVANWKEAVCVSKNPGGTKRVTSLADALKLNFGIVTTDRRRAANAGQWNESAFYDQLRLDGTSETPAEPPVETPAVLAAILDADAVITPVSSLPTNPRGDVGKPKLYSRLSTTPLQRRSNGAGESTGSPLSQSMRVNSVTEPDASLESLRESAAPGTDDQDQVPDVEEYTDERARDVIHGRLVHGRIVDESHPSPSMSAASHSPWRNAPSEAGEDDYVPEHMLSSFHSTASSARQHWDNEHAHALGGTIDAAASSEDEEEDLINPDVETMVTLVGNVKGRPVFLVDDMIDKSASWIAAAETVVKRGGATSVYCMATHGLFGGDCLEEMNDCESIDKIIVTNAFPIPEHKRAQARGKLVTIPVDGLLAEAIRRNHHGESISQLFMHYD